MICSLECCTVIRETWCVVRGYVIMRILNIYVTKDFVYTAAVSIIVLTFGMMGLNLLKVFDYLSRGLPLGTTMIVLILVIPKILALTIPLSVLIATMLVFGRMSADNEITAMRACGISILQIISPIMILTFLLTCLCLYLQLDLSPRYSGKARNLLKNMKAVGAIQANPAAILEAGKPVEYENFHVYIDDKVGDNEIKGIQIFILSKDRERIKQDITATCGRLEADKEKEMLKIILFDATTVVYDEQSKQPARIFAKRKEFSIDYGRKLNEIKIGEKPQFLSIKELLGRTVMYKKLGRDITRLEVELNQRIALGLSPIALLLLGMPLAIRTSRKETSIGLFLSVLLAGLFFISIMVFQAFYMHPEYHPQILLWIPNIVYQVGGTIFIYRIIGR